MSHPPGTSFEVTGYRIERLLGERGSVAVFRAQRLDEAREVAVQVFDVEANPDVLYEAIHETRHDGIARVVQRGRIASGAPYWVLEPLGVSLAEQLAEHGVLDVARATHLGQRLCAGLVELHRAGRFHGAIGPSAIYGLPEASRLAAFGAVVAGDPYRGAGTAGLTQDVHAIGAVLLEAVTGAAPGDLAALVAAPQPLREVLARCFATDGTRFPSATELGVALAAPRDERGTKTPVVNRRDPVGIANTMRATPVGGPEMPVGPVPRTAGAVLGSYRIVQLLGEGGMGRVYLAEHARLGRRVALKLLREELGADPQTVSRFFAEARAVNRIEHENIVEITDFLENPGGDNYYIMEFLPGQNLEQAAHGGQAMKLSRSLGIIVQVCSALASVHAAGIVHRDLKPENIFLTERGGQKDFVKLLDFGIAKLGEGDEGVATHRTGKGIIMGTPEYMSPEQASGVAVDHRSDIFSLGIILYELITSQNPYPGTNFGELLVSRLSETPAPPSMLSSVREHITPELDAIVLRCLARERENRPQSIREVEDALRAIAAADSYELETFTGQIPLLLPAPRRSWMPIAIGGALAVLATGITAGLLSRHPSTPAPMPAPAAVTPPAVVVPIVATPSPPPEVVPPEPVDASAPRGKIDRVVHKGITRHEVRSPGRHGVIDPFK